MDRIANSLSRSLIWLLLGAALIGIPWAVARWNAPGPQRDVAAVASTGSHIPPGRPAAESAQPGLFPLAELSQGPARGGHPRFVLRTGFPVEDGQPQDGEILIGPELFGTPAPAPEPAVRAVPVDPADWPQQPQPSAESEPAEQPEPVESSEDRTAVDVAPPAVQAAESGVPLREEGDSPIFADTKIGTVPEPAPVVTPSVPQDLSMPESEPSILLPFDEVKPRSEQLEAIARQSDRHVRHGFELAGKGAYFAARAEFIAALRLLAQGLDAEYQTKAHSQSLSAALTALQEAEDFIPKGSQLEADLDLPGLIARHRTPVLKDVDGRAVAPMSALRCYFTFAQEQLAAAVRREVAGSMALHALGKLHAAYARHKTIRVGAAEPKAMTFYQAALLAFPRNHMAANDLGVLLAQAGAWPEARAAFEHSLTIHRQSAGWHNLAVVYQQLGQHEMARRAVSQAAAARRDEAARAGGAAVAAQPAVRWVDPQTFAQAAGNGPGMPPIQVAAPPQAGPPAPRGATARGPAVAPTAARRTASQPQATRN